MLNVEVSVDVTQDMGPKTREGVMRFLAKGADKGQSIALDRAPVDRGRLQQGIYPPVVEGNTVRWGTEGVPYAEAIDQGTDPFWAPAAPLVEWARRVFGDGSIGYAVQHKIAEEGIDAQPFVDPGVEAQKRYYRSHSPRDEIRSELE